VENIGMYYKYSDYLKKRFGTRVRRVSVDAGFSCPNRDGKLSTEGCIYCNNKAFSAQHRSGYNMPVEEQIELGMKESRKRFRAEKFIVYFQAFTNTYAPIERLKDVYDKIKQFKDIVSVSIATRPDCIDKDVLSLISSYAEDYEVWIEYGLQSVHDNTLKFINRGHSYHDFLNAFFMTRRYPIKICAHVILGLPYETKAMMVETARQVSSLKIDGIKIHPLHVVKDTKLELLYSQGEFKPLSLNEYESILYNFMSFLSPDIVVQRLSAYCPKEILVAPDWVGKKQQIWPCLHRTNMIYK
jgi:uncharacterized protein